MGNIYKRPETRTFTIDNGSTASNARNLQDYTIFTLHFPAAFTGASVSFQASTAEGGTYLPLYDSDENLISIPVTVSRAYTLSGAEADAVAGAHWLKVVSASSEGAARTITMQLK